MKLAAISSVFAAGALLSGVAAAQTVPVGEAGYNARCASCHKSADRLLPGLRKIAEDRRLAHLDRFLARHNAPDPVQRAEIAAWLVQRAGSSK